MAPIRLEARYNTQHMPLADQVRFHEQWLRSIDSNLERHAASLAKTQDALAVVAQNQSNFAAEMTALAREQRKLAEEHRKFEAEMKKVAAQHRRLEATLERFIRASGGGNGRKRN
jgi:septal ring factor EnvC (AmiA/AmiB activator)